MKRNRNYDTFGNRPVIAVLLCLLLSVLLEGTASTAQQAKKKKLYISSIKAEGVSPGTARRVRECLTLTIFERYGKNYQVLDDDAIRVMYKQAEKILVSGCTDRICMTQISDGINADEIIYGDVRREEGKIRLVLTNLVRNPRTLSLGTKSKVSVPCLESEIDHFAGEAARKLIDPGYRINMKASVSFDERVNLKAIKVVKVQGLDIGVMKFQSRDDSIAAILGYLKELVEKGDASYRDVDYEDARGQYDLVLEKVKGLRPEKQRKMTVFVTGVKKRISSSYVMQYKWETEAVDRRVKSREQADLDELIGLKSGYNAILNKVNSVDKAYASVLAGLMSSLKERIDSMISALAGLHEKKGDIAYREYRFEDALDYYKVGNDVADDIRNRNKRYLLTKRLKGKMRTAETTGESYLANRVKLLLDQAEFHKLKDETRASRETLQKAMGIIKGSSLTGKEARIAYNSLAELMGSEMLFCDTVGGIKFVYIKGVSFMMGSNNGYDDEKPVHRVTVSGFWMSRCEVTQMQYMEIMGNNPSHFKGDNLPVENVSWNDAMEFCKGFNEKYGVKVRLPSEAEWEYACRAGSTTKYYWGNEVNGDYCWYFENSGGKYENHIKHITFTGRTHPVGTKRPNAWGLYDMSGNVSEWCIDRYDKKYYSKSPERDPKGPWFGSRRVVRGSNWFFVGDPGVSFLRSACRNSWDDPGYKFKGLGFRLVGTD